MKPLIRRVYEEVGLTETAIQTIATARPQRDVYMTHEELGQRLFSLPHGPLTLDCIARNSADDHALMDDLLQKEGREGFAAAWLRVHGHAAAAQQVEAWWRQQRDRGKPMHDPDAEGESDAEAAHALRGAE